MTDNEIIKALECCDKNNCFCCPYRMDNVCISNLRNDALDLINRQKAEINRWESECGKQSVLWRSHFESIFETAKETIRAEAIKEFAERLKKDLCDLEFNANTERKTIRVSELREQVDWVLHTVFIEIIDNRANEMTREQGNDRLPVDKKNGSRN